MEHKSDGDTNCKGCSRYSHQRIDKGDGGVGNNRTTGDHPNYSIIKIGKNTKKSSGDLRSLHHHHHHVVPQTWISLTLSRHFSLSFIISGRSSVPHPVSSHRCWMYVRAGRPAFARPCVGDHRSTSLMSSSASPAVSCMSGSSSLDSFRDGRQVAV